MSSIDQANVMRDALENLLSDRSLRWRYKPKGDYFECRGCGARHDINYGTGKVAAQEPHISDCPWKLAEEALQD